MQMIDEKGRLFGVVNVLDLMFLLIIIIGLLIGWKYFSGRAIDGTKANVYFVVELKSVKKDFAEKIKMGDEIKDSIKGYYLGKVSNIDIMPEESTNWSAISGEFVESESPEDYTVLVEILANGTVKNEEGFIYAETVPVSVGKEMFIKGKGYAKAGYITKVYVEALKGE